MHRQITCSFLLFTCLMKLSFTEIPIEKQGLAASTQAFVASATEKESDTSTLRAPDYAFSINKVIDGFLKGNLEKVIAGGFSFIPDPIRAGVTSLLGVFTLQPNLEKDSRIRNTTRKSVTQAQAEDEDEEDEDGGEE